MSKNSTWVNVNYRLTIKILLVNLCKWKKKVDSCNIGQLDHTFLKSRIRVLNRITFFVKKWRTF